VEVSTERDEKGLETAMIAVAVRHRILLVSLVSTTVEFYSFFVYATAAAVVLGPLYFPSSSSVAQLLSAWGSFALAFVARPLGAALFGHFGDRRGARSALAGAMLLMGGSTFAIGLLPTHATIGWAAPVLLCLFRFGQGLGLGGQWGGAVLIAVDGAPANRRGLYAMVPQLGAPLSFMIANGIFLLLGSILSETSFLAWGWRIPFLLATPLMAIGFWMRQTLTDPQVALEGAVAAPRLPIASLLRHEGAAVMIGTLGVVACFVLYYLATAFALGHATTTLGHSRQQFLLVQICVMPFMALGTIIAGGLSDAIGHRTVLLSGAVLTIIVGLLLGPAVGGAWNIASAIFLCAALLVLGLMYGTLAGWLPTLFSAKLRYTGTSLAFNVAGVVGGALTPLFSTFLTHLGGLHAVGIYVALAGAVSAFAVMASRRYDRALVPSNAFLA